MAAEATYDYDIAVVGSGPAGQRAAIQGAKLGRRVALIEKEPVPGGVCLNTGTIPSKTLREAALYLSGYRERGVYGSSYAVKHKITMQDLRFRTEYVIRHEIDVVRHQVKRNGVDLINATASFGNAHTLHLVRPEGAGRQTITADKIVLAVGTAPTRDSHIPFDGKTVFTSDDILGLEQVPKTLAVVGAGVIGCEYASMFAALGVRVTMVDKRKELLSMVDPEISDALAYQLRENRVTLRLGEEVSGIDTLTDARGAQVRILLASGKQIFAEKVLYSVGRTGAVSSLGIDLAGLCADDRGRLKVNACYQTCQPNIYAVGDVIGFPSLASTSMEQGRLAACHACGVPARTSPEVFPYGIYTIPEISMVGKTETDLTREGIPYEIGRSRYREIARGQIIGDQTGLLKLIFHLETRELLGVHILGEQASEMIHIGQAVMSFRGEVDYFIQTVFNYPTLAEAYKVAAFDGINRLGITLT